MNDTEVRSAVYDRDFQDLIIDNYSISTTVFPHTRILTCSLSVKMVPQSSSFPSDFDNHLV